MVVLDDVIGEWTSVFGTDELLALLSAHGVPAGRVYTAADMVDDPHFKAREMVVRAASRAGYDVPMPGVVPKFSRTPGRIDDVGPDLGEHTRQVLAQLAGVGDAEWSELLASGVVA
jgi:crotonobetainyl-CoA:carnitine CoA-transferase CaiB-like acyl-CoA transferase